MATLIQDGQSLPAQTASPHPFTCNTCQVAFRTSDLQRAHMQSDWHRYNLKRRVASLPPLNSEVFAEKVLANKASAAATAARARFEKTCDACDKTYYSEGAYANHLGSQKHTILSAKLNARRRNLEDTETESMVNSTFTLGETLDTTSTQNEDLDAEEEFEEVVQGIKDSSISEPPDPVPRPHIPTPSTAAQHDAMLEGRRLENEEYEHKANLDQCLFCNYISPTMDLNIAHMSRQHGFSIPERDYLVDLPGLVNYLSETVVVLHQCLYCHKTVHTTSGIQTHMRDRGHCMIAYSTEEEQMDVGEFYDFRSTYSDEESDGEDTDEAAPGGGVRLGPKRAVKTTVENGDTSMAVDGEDDEDWESDSSLSSVPTDEISSVPIEHQDHKYAKLDLHRHHSHTDPRPHKNQDGFHSHAHHTPHAVYYDDYELHLPSGRTAGHRSLKMFYRQNLRNYPSVQERAQQQMIEEHHYDSDADDEDTEDAASIQQNDTSRGRQLVSRANGGLGMVGVSAEKKRQIKAVERRDQKRDQRAQARYQWGNERRANFQKHFRDPLLQ